MAIDFIGMKGTGVLDVSISFSATLITHFQTQTVHMYMWLVLMFGFVLKFRHLRVQISFQDLYGIGNSISTEKCKIFIKESNTRHKATRDTNTL